MDSDNTYIKQIFKDLDFSEKEIELINNAFKKVKFNKGAVLIEEGETVNTQYFIMEGCLRSYRINKLGKEFTVQFGVKDWWISDYTAFFSSEKAIMTVEVIQDAILYKITNEQKEFLYDQVPKIEHFFRLKLEKAFASFQKRIIANLSLTAAERYINFITTYPNIEQSVKNYHIASYLGITTESLSRIRKELAH
ncbi:Crp/Fnr family transcriptional regulator [Winogradskyella sp. Asnod2-B02-A]|uniref:Crp/Fnr family transcriptional regulator n=1 Tax=Winogradskyella sp. Asnod2-B02-A TaxID=3160583 RepID=UPI00386F95F6